MTAWLPHTSHMKSASRHPTDPSFIVKTTFHYSDSETYVVATAGIREHFVGFRTVFFFLTKEQECFQ